LFANAAGSPGARMRDSHESGGIIMQLAGKRDALMPPNPEELLDRPQ